jgi:autotransporter family porin
MATWKKVVVSGSSAELAALKVDNLTSGQVVIGGGNSANLSTTAINGSGNILATTGATNVSISGSFSGSFFGNGSGLTGVTATFPTTAKTDLTSTDQFFINDGVNKFVTYGNLLTDLAGTNLAVESTDSLTLASTITGITSISSTSFTGSLQGTASVAVSSSYALTASFALNVPATASFALTASQAITASFALNAAKVNNALTLGNGLTGANYDGSTAITAAVGAGALITVSADATMVTTSSLTTNQIPKYSANALAGSNISDTGTQVQIAAGASSGLSVAAGGINVTGNSTFNNNLVVSGDLTVAGTASFQNSQNLLIRDQFILLASGSNTLVDGGIIVANGGLSGSAMYLEVASSGNYGRWAVASELNAGASTATADEYVVTSKINQASNPSAAPTWGSTTNGSGNMWITNAGDIFIYA